MKGAWHCGQAGRLNRLLGSAAADCIRRQLLLLSEATREAAVFATLASGDRTVLARHDGGQSVGVSAQLLQSGKLYDTPTGRVLTAFAGAEELQAILDRHGFPGGLWEDIRDKASFERALASLRSSRICVMAPAANEVAGFAAPVLDGQSRLIGAIGCHAPMFRCAPDRQQAIAAALKRSADSLSRNLSPLME